MPHRRSKRSNATLPTDTNAKLDALRSQVTRLKAMVGSFEMLLVKYSIPPPTVVETAQGKQITRTTTQWGCSRRCPAPSSLATASKPVMAPLLAHHPREFFPDRFSASLVIAEDLMGHVVGRGGRGLKQVTDISSARVSAFTQKVGSCSERLVSIRGTDKQLGDALMVLEKRIACKHVSAPKKKKKSTASSGLVNVAPGPSPRVALQNPSAPITQPPSCQTATPTRGRVHPSVASQTRAPQPSLPPPTPLSRTVVMASSSQSRDWSATPVVPSVHMASPNSMPEPLTPMDVDHIMAVTGWQNSDWPAQQRLELATRLWNRGVVVQTFDRWEVGETD